MPVTVHVRASKGFFGRFRGLIAQPPPPPGEALLLEPCHQVHSMFMGYPIDVVHLDETGRVLAVQTLKPWRLGRWLLRAVRVIELRAGEAGRLGLEEGVQACLIEVDARVTTGIG